MMAIDVANARGVAHDVIVTLWRLPTIDDPAALRKPSHGGKVSPGHFATPSVLDANGRIVVGRYVDPSLGPLGPIEWADAQRRIAERREARIAGAAITLERRMTKAEAKRLRKKARAMAEEREKANAALEASRNPALPMNDDYSSPTSG